MPAAQTCTRPAPSVHVSVKPRSTPPSGPIPYPRPAGAGCPDTGPWPWDTGRRTGTWGGGSTGRRDRSPRMSGGSRRPMGVGTGHRRQQRPRVWMQRVPQQFLRLRHLHDLAQVHHGDPVAHVPRHRQVMSDVQVGGCQGDRPVSCINDMIPVRLENVQHGCGFVGDHERRADHQARGQSPPADAARPTIRGVAGTGTRRPARAPPGSGSRRPDPAGPCTWPIPCTAKGSAMVSYTVRRGFMDS